MNLQALVTGEMGNAARQYVGQETGHWMSAEELRSAYDLNINPKFSLAIEWFFLARDFLCGAVYQNVFVGREITNGTLLACVAHINRRMEPGAHIYGSLQQVIVWIGLDLNQPENRGAMALSANAFIAGAKWATKQCSTNPKIINLVLDSMGKIGVSLAKSRVQKKRRDRDYLIGHFIQAGIEHPATCDCRFPGDDHWHATHGEFNHEYHAGLKARGFLPILREAAEKDLLTGNDEYGKSGALKSELRKLLDGFLVDEPDHSWFGEKS